LAKEGSVAASFSPLSEIKSFGKDLPPPPFSPPSQNRVEGCFRKMENRDKSRSFSPSFLVYLVVVDLSRHDFRIYRAACPFFEIKPPAYYILNGKALGLRIQTYAWGGFRLKQVQRSYDVPGALSDRFSVRLPIMIPD